MRAPSYPLLLGVAIVVALSSTARATDADDADKAFDQGTTAFEKHDFDLAIRYFNDAIRLDPKSAKAICSRGRAYGNKGDVDKAIADYRAAMPSGLTRKCAKAFCGRGRAYGNKGDIDKAIADCTEAIRLDPKSAEAYCNRGMVFARRGDWKKGHF